jgi:hypothetical protein
MYSYDTESDTEDGHGPVGIMEVLVEPNLRRIKSFHRRTSSEGLVKNPFKGLPVSISAPTILTNLEMINAKSNAISINLLQMPGGAGFFERTGARMQKKPQMLFSCGAFDKESTQARNKKNYSTKSNYFFFLLECVLSLSKVAQENKFGGFFGTRAPESAER